MPMTSPISKITEFLALGGPVVSFLLVISVIALALVLVKLVQFTQISASKAKQPNSPAYKAVHDKINDLKEGTNTGSVTHDDAIELAEVIALGQINKYRSGLRALDLIVQIAPLIGLFGTVLGMIDAFQALQTAGSNVDPAVLAGGIWVALLTTAVGLGVAMPTNVALTYLESRLERYQNTLHALVYLSLNPAANGSYASIDQQ